MSHGARISVRSSWLGALLAGAAALLVSCCSADEVARRIETTAPSTAVVAETPVRAAFMAARHADGDGGPAYAMKSLADGAAFVARHPRLALRAELTERGASIAKPGEPWQVTLSGGAVACNDREVPLDVVAPRAGSRPNRVDYTRRAGAVAIGEWYVNGPLGFEQGFSMAEMPCNTDRHVVVKVHVEGLTATADEHGTGVVLKDSFGLTRLRYTDLAAHDSAGNQLDATMTAAGDEIALDVKTEGARFPIEIDPLVWQQVEAITASNGMSGDDFGEAVALSDDVAIVGAYGFNDEEGAAYVFVRSGATWTQQAQLVPTDGTTPRFFGSAVALSGNTAIVGAEGTSVGSVINQGVAYVFTQSGTSWTEQARLVANDGVTYDYFGNSIAIEGDTALVGAFEHTDNEGAVYVFSRTGTTWTQGPELTGTDSVAGDLFGSSVRMSGTTAIFGAAGATIGANARQGAAYVFVQSGTTWTQQAKLVASEGLAQDQLGEAVDISGGLAVLASASAKIGANTQEGVAYVFGQSGTTWTEQAKLVPSDGQSDGYFGTTAAISGSTLLIGSIYGPAYFYTQSGSGWTLQQEIMRPLLTESSGVALSGTTAMIAAAVEPANGTDVLGAVLVEGYGLPNGTACASATSCASGSCVDGVCCGTACNSLCQACTAVKKQDGSADGTCGNALAGSNPHTDPCGPDPASNCQRNGECDGAGQCQLYASGTACGNTCVGGLATPDSCDGHGNCEAGAGTSCAPDSCVGGVCATSCATTADCAPSAYCANGTCTSRIGPGGPCSIPDSCLGAGAVCVDGVCCDNACPGQCEACDVVGSVGICEPVPAGAPHGTRAPCAGGGTACGGACNGEVSVTACQFPGTNTSCGTTCANDEQTARSCNGDGECVSGATTPCRAGYGCDGTTMCTTGCSLDADCAVGYRCAAGACVAVAGGTCAADGHTAAGDGGAGVDCTPYVCSAGTCATSCASSSDCVAPTICEMGRCTAPTGGDAGGAGNETSTPGNSGGCAIEDPRTTPPTRGAMVFALVALVRLRRRRRR